MLKVVVTFKEDSPETNSESHHKNDNDSQYKRFFTKRQLIIFGFLVIWGKPVRFFGGNGMSEDTGMLKPVAFSKMNENRQESCLIRLSRSDGKSGNIKYCSRFFYIF